LRARGGQGGRGEERVWQEGVERESKRGYPGRETSGSRANKLSKGHEQLLVGLDQRLGGHVRGPLEEAGSLVGRRGAGQDGMLEGLRGFGA